MNADKTDLKKEIRNCLAALPVSLSYPRKSAFICGEFVLVVGVGIKPTFRAFQARANPSQLSDRRLVSSSKSQVSSKVQLETLKLKLETLLGPPFLLGMHLFHDVTIIVHIHEQVLAPFGSCLCVVTEHNAFELHAQRRLRCQQRHSCFCRSAIALPVVALDTSRDYVYGRVITAARTRQNVIER